MILFVSLEVFIVEHINKKAIASFQAIIVYIVLVLGIASSYLMNLHNGTPLDQIISNYGFSVVGMIFPVILKPGHKYWKAFLFIVSMVWFIYLLLYYLIGFHNPHWQ